MRVNTASTFLKPKQIEELEQKYNAKYVLESCLKGKDGSWLNRPAAIFYTEDPHPEGSNYFAIYLDYNMDGTLVPMITNGLSAINEVVFLGLEAEGEVIYSRFRHDYRDAKNGAYVDGGRDYFKYGGDRFDDYNIVRFKVAEGNIEFV